MPAQAQPPPDDVQEAIVPVVPGATADAPDGATWPDESAEAAFLAEARERGEPVAAEKPRDVAEETDARPLPSLDELVQRIPSDVRDTLDELFRARFVAVRRVPKKALKPAGS